MERIISKYWWLILIALSIPAIWALAVPGFYGASDDLHVAWLQQMDKLVRMGKFPPRFVPDLSYAFGYPLFNFVFPLPFYLGEIFHLVGFSLVDSVKIVFGLSLVLSSLAMYLLLRELTTKSLSLAGALLYLYTPYRSVDVYIRGAFGEAVAFIFLPLIALSVIKVTTTDLTKTQIRRWLAIGALSLAGLVLSHNITTYMFFPFLVLLGAARLWPSKAVKFHWPSWVPLLTLIVLGLLTTIYFWAPALLDSTLMKYDTVFNYVDHFPTLVQLFFPYWGYGASVPGPGDGLPFFMGIVNIVLLVLSPIVFFIFAKKISRGKKTIFLWAYLVFIAALVMMNYRSIFLWQHLPLVPYFQFPWRFLILTTFLSPLFLIVFSDFKYQKQLAFIFSIAAVAINFSFFQPHDFLGRTDSYYLNRYIPNPGASYEYSQTQEEYLRLTNWTKTRPDRLMPLAGSPYGSIVYVEKLNDLDATVAVKSDTSFTLDYNKYYFPGWQALVDGQSVEIKPGSPYGQIQVQVPAGEHKVKFAFIETPFKLILDLISLISFMICIWLIFSWRMKRMV